MGEHGQYAKLEDEWNEDEEQVEFDVKVTENLNEDDQIRPINPDDIKDSILLYKNNTNNDIREKLI
jgi:hypothetical protein